MLGLCWYAGTKTRSVERTPALTSSR